ncbi:MAG: DegT/DnrJ/EryC1/StrS family aminotransferase [Candidatus Omnitrophota bacterium]
MTAIPFFDLSQEHRQLKAELDAAYDGILERSEFVLGESVKRFEEAFASYIGTRYAVGVSSGLDALELALRAAGIGAGDEVLVPANTFVATALAVSGVGAVPVFVDCDEKRCLLDLESAKKAISPMTKAVIPVHLYGQPVEMQPLIGWCCEHNLQIIEDAAQAHGARVNGQSCGSLGRFGCFSFYPSKNLGALGDAGIITLNDKADYDRLCLLRNYGSVVKYRHEIVGFNKRLDGLQAAFLSVKLPHLKSWNESRVALARRYDERLSGVGDLRLLETKAGHESIYHLYVIRTQKCRALQEFLRENQVATAIHYPVPIHRQPAYQNLSMRAVALPVAERDAERLLSLPMYPQMPPQHVDRVADLIGEFFCR